MKCNECPLRLYNKKHHNLQGIGNPWSDNVIIIPNVDYDAYKVGNLSFSNQVDIISAILPTGVLATNCYIVPLIRCNESISCKVNDDIIRRCITYLIDDLNLYNWHNILVCGSAWTRLFNREITSDFNNCIYSVKHKRIYLPNYNPLIKYIDDNKFEIFKNRLIEWYNTSISKLCPNYEMLYI